MPDSLPPTAPLRLTIVGSGWLGLPLARHLAEQGHQVTSTCRNAARQGQLQQLGLSAVCYDSRDPATVQALPPCDLLISTLPPRPRECNYGEQLNNLHNLAKQQQIPRLLLVSSTSVYGNATGKIDEQHTPEPATESGKALWQTEQALLADANIDASIIRFAGLYGPGRHPGRFLADKRDVANPEAPVNLIHLDDCIGLIYAIIDQDYWGHAINGSAPGHPTRREFYVPAATQLQRQPPQFVAGGAQEKQIDSAVIGNELSYQFMYPSPLAWLESDEAREEAQQLIAPG